MTEYSIRQLAAATILQAAKDYFDGTDKQRAAILKDLRSAWMDTFTNGVSLVVATQLENNPDEIKARLQKNKERLK